MGAGGDLFFLSLGPGVFGLLGMSRKWSLVRWKGKCGSCLLHFQNHTMMSESCSRYLDKSDLWKKMRHSIFLCIIWNVLSFMKVYHSDPQHAMSGAETPECRTPYQGAWGVTCDKGCLMCLASVATSRVTFKCLWNKIQNLAISMCFSELYWQLSTKTMLERWVQLSVCRSKVPPKPRRCRWPMLWRWGV